MRMTRVWQGQDFSHRILLKFDIRSSKCSNNMTLKDFEFYHHWVNRSLKDHRAGKVIFKLHFYYFCWFFCVWFLFHFFNNPLFASCFNNLVIHWTLIVISYHLLSLSVCDCGVFIFCWFKHLTSISGVMSTFWWHQMYYNIACSVYFGCFCMHRVSFLSLEIFWKYFIRSSIFIWLIMRLSRIIFDAAASTLINHSWYLL